MVEVGQVEDLQVEPRRAGPLPPGAEPVDDLATVPARSCGAISDRPIASVRRATSASSRPTHVVWATERTSCPGSRPAAAHASSTRANWAAAASTDANGTLNSAANRAASSGVRRLPIPPTITGGCGSCTGLGSAGESATV